MSCIRLIVDSPGRIVRMSASGLISDCLMPNALSSCGVATKIWPDQERPFAAWFRLALLVSSGTRLVVPSPAAMSFATVGAAAIWAAVGLLSGTSERPLVLPGAYTMSWLDERFGPA